MHFFLLAHFKIYSFLYMIQFLQQPGDFLFTSIYRHLTDRNSVAETSSQLRLEDGQKYWVGKIGGGYFVVVRKTTEGDVRLVVRHNRIPKVVSQKVLRLKVVRERPDVNLDAEGVLVLEDECGH